MPYLEFFSITTFCEHLQASNIDEAFVCYDSEVSKVSKLEFHRITFSPARVITSPYVHLNYTGRRTLLSRNTNG